MPVLEFDGAAVANPSLSDCLREHFVRILIVVAATVLLAGSVAHAQIGNLLWEENFNDLDNWIAETGNGNWGWGNGELQYYSANNVDIATVPGEVGNTALRITARQESGPGIVDQWGSPLNYTSGKVISKSKVSLQYGMIETRVRVPDLDLGGWPAVWLLGTSNWDWPRKGEIDMMEMGGRKDFRDLHDGHNGGNGLNNSTVNQTVGANAIFYSDAAITPENPTGAASISWDPDDDYARPYYNYSPGLTERFLTYRLYWDDSSMRMTVIDNDVEHDLFASPFTIDDESDEFRKPFYLIANMAVGGAYTDAYQLGNPASGQPVSMPFSAEMYVDYIRAYEWNGQGAVHVGPPTPQSGSYGIFTDNTPTNGKLIPGVNAEVFVWEGTLAESSIPPLEGDNALSWQTTGKGWFGAGVLSHQPLNVFDFDEGHLNFDIQIPANVTFKIGIIDAWGNQQYVSFPANQTTYGLVRDGQWGQASIPVSDIRGTAIDLRMLSYSFVILEEQGTSANFALDNIYWDSPNSTGGLLGDYNDDGTVDAADYTVWRDALASGGSLLNDPTPDVVDQSDYLYWRTHFGETQGSGTGSTNSAVPEPATLSLISAALLGHVLRRRRATKEPSAAVGRNPNFF
jgi:beta-glucanase (GH16 family)